MCDNKNELHQYEYDKSEDYTSTRLDLDITETTDSYPEFDFLDLLRNLQVKEKKVKHKTNSEISSNKSNLFSDEDSDVEALAKIYEEKYGTCNDYAELGEGYDEEDSFIDNSDVVNDLVPNGLQTEFGGFYINRGKLNFVKEDNSSSSTSEDVDKFLAHNRLNPRRIISDDESEEKESCQVQSNNQQISGNANSVHNSINNISSSNNNSNINNNINNNSNNNNNNNYSNNSNNANSSYNHGSINNNSSLHSSVIKSRKRSREYQHKSKKIRKTATPKIPDHLLHKKPFPGSLEFRKNINEFKKNRLKTVESNKKYLSSNLVVNSGNSDGDSVRDSQSNNISTVSGSVSSNNNNNNNNNNSNNGSSNNNNNISSTNSNKNNSSSNQSEDDDKDHDKKEGALTKKKPLTVKELLKEREEVSELGKISGGSVQEGREKVQNSSSSESSDSSSSDSDSCSSDDSPNEKEKPIQKSPEEASPKGSATINGSISKEITAKSFAHLSDGLKDLVAKVFEISKEEKNKFFNSRLNPLLLSLYEKLRELPMGERNSVLEQVSDILQMKKGNITKRIKKLLVIQEETKMSAPLRKLKDAVANIMPLLESNYFNEYTKAAGTSPQIYAELSRYYWSIDPGSLPQRKFPWNDDLRRYLQEIVQYRKNCFFIIRPRKESLTDYIRSFLETKVKSFWPKEWMTVEILLEEAQVTTARQSNDKQKNVTKVLGAQNSGNISQKKLSPSVPNRKQMVTVPTSSAATAQTANRKPAQSGTKTSEVKSILIPRKTPLANTSLKSNFPASSLASLQNLQQGSRLQVTLNRMNVQEYLDRVSGSQTSIGKSPHQQQQQQQQQQISPNRSQQSVSPNRLVKSSSPNSVLNSSAFRSGVSPKNTSPGGSNKSISSSARSSSSSSGGGASSNPQSVLKSVGVHGNPVSSAKTSQNSVTISPVNESLFKDISSSPEVLNLTKNSSVFISKVKEGGESKGCRSSSPSIGIPLPSGITISPTNASPSTFLTKIPKQLEKNPDVKINVSITKQDGGGSQAKEKREGVLSVNVKREGPLQNIPDCISVTSKVVPNERPKYEHVRKRALQEYHQRHSPEGLKFEEKKVKTEENLLSDIEIREDRFDEKNFSKIFDSVIAKTSETVRQSETGSSQMKTDKFGKVGVDLGGSGNSGSAKNSSVSQYKNYPTKLRDVRSPKEKGYYLGGGEERNYSDSEDRSKHAKEQRVQMEMDRVMQNLVELSREKNPEYELGYPSSPTSSSGLKSTNFQEPYQKLMFK